jgi:hypothetical protein
LSGTASITESTAGGVTYTITCTAGSQTATASVLTVHNPRPSGGATDGGSGGGGALGLFTVLSLLASCVLRATCARRE